MTKHELLSRVMGVASRSRGALPLPEVTLEHEADLLVSSLSAPPSVRALIVDGPALVTDESCCGMLGRTVFVAGGVAPFGHIGVPTRGGQVTSSHSAGCRR